MQTGTVTRAPKPIQILGRDLGNLDEIARANAVRQRTRDARTKRHWPCPICGETDNQCIAYADPERQTQVHVWCIRGEGVPGALHLPSWGFRQDRGGAWYFVLDGRTGEALHKTAPAASARDYPLSDPETIAQVLDATVRAFGLSAEHQAQLVGRGYPADECGPDLRYRFASLPADPAARMAVANRLMASFASAGDLLGTYGYSQDRRRHKDGIIAFLPRLDGAALLEMVLDTDARIVGFQYTPDTPPLDKKGKPLKRITPARMALTGRYHVARPLRDACVEIWHTEAIHKANLTARARHAPAVGILGAGNAANIEPAARALDPDAKRLQVLALDKDQWGGPAETAAARRLLELGYRVALARWPDDGGKGPDDALAAGAAIHLQPFEDTRAKPRRDERIAYAYPWQHREETQEDRQALLAETAARITARTRAHIESDQRSALLVLASAPGVGKSTAVAALGMHSGRRRRRGELDLAWIAQRKEMASSLNMVALGYHIMEPCTEDNCSSPDLHNAVAQSGRLARAIHKQHAEPCAYVRQFQRSGSTFYNLGHVKTREPARHQAIIVDELNLPDWLPETAYSVARLHATAATFPTESTANRLLRALQAVIADDQHTGQQAKIAGQVYTGLHGKALFDALNGRCGGQLDQWLSALPFEAPDDLRRLPQPIGIYLDDPNALERARNLPPVVLPHIWHALRAEQLKWRKGGEWNSRLRIGPHSKDEWALYITRPLALGKIDGEPLPPRILLDATADTAILARLFGSQVQIHREETAPPPHMRHIAVRTITHKATAKRYGKVSMTAPHTRERSIKRAANEARYLLRELDPHGSELAAGRIGLITHQGCERELAEAIGIPYSAPERLTQGNTGHFWGIRGSNRLEHCTILLIVGTPAMQPEDVKRMARAIYADDPTPLDTAYDESTGDYRYQDTRLQGVADALSQAELTQCAHRNRPLRYDGRTVISMCSGMVDFLPVTTEVHGLPHLTDDGEARATVGKAKAEQRLQQAADALRERGASISIRSLASEAHVSLREAAPWLKAHKDDYVKCGVIPELLLDTYSNFGITSQIHSQHPPLAGEDGPPSPGLLVAAQASPATESPRRFSFEERLSVLKAQGMREDLAIARLLAENEARKRAGGGVA